MKREAFRTAAPRSPNAGKPPKEAVRKSVFRKASFSASRGW
jgi:hypothetical protein